MPRFTLYSRFPGRIDAERQDEIIAVGYVATRRGNVFMTGQHDGEPCYMIFREPGVRKFSYLEGVLLATSVGDGAPFATRIVCQYIGARAERRRWQERITLYSEEDFHRQFNNADVIERALGKEELRLASEVL